MTDGTTPSQRAGLRHEIAKAIHRYDNEHALSGNDIPSRHHRGEADAVMALLYQEWPWLRAEAEELAEGAATEPTPAYGCTIGGVPAMPILISEYNQLVAELAEARARLARVQALADEYPVGIDTALIEEALDTTPAAAQATDRTTRLDTLARDILSAFVPTRDSSGMHITHHQARVLPHEMQAWQDTLDETEQP